VAFCDSQQTKSSAITAISTGQSLAASVGSSNTFQSVSSLIGSHPICGVSIANWNLCNDLTQTTNNLLNTFDSWTQNITDIGGFIRNNVMSVGGAHAFVAFNNTVAYADPFLQNSEGVFDPLVSLSNCTRFFTTPSFDHVCFRILHDPRSKQSFMSVVVGNGTLSVVSAPNDRRRSSCVKKVGEGVASGAVVGAITGGLAGAGVGAATGAAGALADCAFDDAWNVVSGWL
jgi:hypothetical protein